MKYNTLLSILILSIQERSSSLAALLSNLNFQIQKTGCENVEFLVLTDNKKRSIAEKRNNLLSIAKGKYICFLDDDDTVSENYIEKLCEALELQSEPDCITFRQKCSINGCALNVQFGLGNAHGNLIKDDNGDFHDIKRPPYHMCLFKRDLVKGIKFQQLYSAEGQSIEDIDWLLRVYPLLKTEHHIPSQLHKYIYDSKKSASKN